MLKQPRLNQDLKEMTMEPVLDKSGSDVNRIDLRGKFNNIIFFANFIFSQELNCEVVCRGKRKDLQVFKPCKVILTHLRKDL